MKKQIIALVLILALLPLTLVWAAANDAGSPLPDDDAVLTYLTSQTSKLFLTVTGAEQGVIAGEKEVFTDKWYEYAQPENSLLILDYDTDVTYTQKGFPTPGAVSFIHRADKATPKLQHAASTGEKLTLHLVKTAVDSSGEEKEVFTADYTGAVIIGDEIFTEGAGGNLLEKITVVFETAICKESESRADWRLNWAEGAGAEVKAGNRLGYPGIEADRYYTMYMTVSGMKQGAINGDCVLYPNTIQTYGYYAGISKAFDDAEKVFTDPAQQLVTVVHKADRTTPQLQRAAAEGEVLTLSLLRMRKNHVTGLETSCFKADYEGVVIRAIDLSSDTGTGALLEKITFTFTKVTYSDPATGESWTAAGME